MKLVNVNSLKPVDTEAIQKYARETGKVITIEEHSVIGGLRSIVSEILIESNTQVRFSYMGFHDEFCLDYGWHQELKRMHGLSPEHIAQKCREMLRGDR